MPESTPSSDPKRSVPGTPAPHMAGRTVPRLTHIRRAKTPEPLAGTVRAIRNRKPAADTSD